MSKLELFEYVYEGNDFEVSFKVFPHLNTEKEVRESIKKFFDINRFWDLVGNHYGYIREEKSLKTLFMHLSISALSFQMDDVIDDQFYSDSFLALTYTLASKLYDMKVLATNVKSAVVLLEGIQKHIEKDLKLKGVFLAWVNLHDRKLYIKHDGLLY